MTAAVLVDNEGIMERLFSGEDGGDRVRFAGELLLNMVQECLATGLGWKRLSSAQPRALTHSLRSCAVAAATCCTSVFPDSGGQPRLARCASVFPGTRLIVAALCIPALACGQKNRRGRSEEKSVTNDAEKIANPMEAPNPICDDLLMDPPGC